MKRCRTVGLARAVGRMLGMSAAQNTVIAKELGHVFDLVFIVGQMCLFLVLL